MRTWVVRLEFQGVEHGAGEALQTASGCVEVVVAHDLYVGVTFP
jgi:hypothetical protein